MSAVLKGCLVIYIFFLIFFRYVITVLTFFIVAYVLQILGTGVAFPLPSVSSAEKVQS